MSTLQVYKIVRQCDSCKKTFEYYRLPNERGRAPSHCSKTCSTKNYLEFRRMNVDFADVPPDWQRKLEDIARKQGNPIFSEGQS